MGEKKLLVRERTTSTFPRRADVGRVMAVIGRACHDMAFVELPRGAAAVAVTEPKRKSETDFIVWSGAA